MVDDLTNPAYDATEVFEYRYGGMIESLSGPPPTQIQWADDDGTIGNDDGAMWCQLIKWDVEPGGKAIEKVHLFEAFWHPTYIDEVYIDVWREDVSDYTLVATTAAITPGGAAGSGYWDVTPTEDLSVVLVAGETYYVGVRCKRNDYNSGTPYVYSSTGITFQQGMLRLAVSAAAWNGSTVPIADVAGSHYAYTSDDVPSFLVYYTSGNMLEADITSNTVANNVIPIPLDHAACVKLEGVVVADTYALEVLCKYMTRNGTYLTTHTLELDCGDTVGGQNDMIFGGNTTNLPDIGGSGQEGKTFDIGVFVTEDLGYADLLWQNRHLEAAVHSHVADNVGRYGAQYANGSHFAYLAASGTATIAKIRVGVRPMIVCGDSQAINGNGTTLRSLITYRWGGLPTEMTRERIWFMAGESGKQIVDWWSDVFIGTAGDADAVEFVRYGTELFLAGMGINDVSAATTTSDELAIAIASTVLNMYSNVLYRVNNDGEDGSRLIFAGLPPYSHSIDTDEYEAKAIRWLNRGIAGLAAMGRVPYYNPWLDMVETGTEDDTIPTFDATNTEDGGVHYSSTGGATALANMVEFYEDSAIDFSDLYTAAATALEPETWTALTGPDAESFTAGNTLFPLGVQLPIDVTGYTVKFKMVNDSGTVIVAETDNGVTVVDAINGKVQYDFQRSELVAGDHYYWFICYLGNEKVTFPATGRAYKLEVFDAG